VRLRYTVPALADLGAILDYIADHSPQTARRVQARIQTIIDLLLRHPQIGRRTNDLAIRRIGATPYPYLIFLPGDRERDRHSCGPPRRARPVLYARLRSGLNHHSVARPEMAAGALHETRAEQ